MLSPRSRSPKLTFGLIAVLLALVAFLALVWFTDFNLLLLWLVASGAVTFALYGYDKLQAKVGGGRVPEIVLHVATLAGGFIGGWLGMILFHHKTRQTRFKVVLLLATLFWLTLLWLLRT